MSDAEHLIVKPLREQWSNRPIDQAAGQRFLFGGAALTLEEAARDAPGGRKFFLVVDGQREEILPRLHVLRGGDRAKHHGFAKGRENRAVGLTGNAARFESERLAAPLASPFLHVEHLISFNARSPPPRRP